jgi:hypothetical protein
VKARQAVGEHELPRKTHVGRAIDVRNGSTDKNGIYSHGEVLGQRALDGASSRSKSAENKQPPLPDRWFGA